jgi:hypothetical protein
MRSLVEGLLPTPKNPSTALRAVSLTRKSGGGIKKPQSMTSEKQISLRNRARTSSWERVATE